jgi:small-conductance mechanosensitive channel
MSHEIRVSLAGFVLLCLSLVFGPAYAQTQPPPPPAGMTQQQHDELVKAVGQSVLQTLTENGLIAKAPAPASAPKLGEVADEDLAVDRIVSILREVPVTLAGYSAVWANLAQLSERLDRTADGGRSTSVYLGLLALAAIVAFFAEVAVAQLTTAARRGIAQRFATNGGLWRLAVLGFMDALAFLALWLIVHLALGTLFAGAGAQRQFASIILRGLVAWRFYVLLIRLYLRPEMPLARIAPIGDRRAAKLYLLFGAAVLIAVIARIWTGVQVSPEAISAAILVNSIVVFAIYAFIIFRARSDISEWLLGLSEGAGTTGIKAALARHWHWLAIPIILALGLARAYEALAERVVAPVGIFLTIDVFFGLLLVETLLSFMIKRHRASVLAASGHPEASRFIPFAVRTIRVTILVVATAVLVRIWAVDVLELVDEQGWANFSRAWTAAVITALLAYFAWEAVRFATERPVGQPPVTAAGQETDSAPTQATASRLQTLAPILRVALGIAIFTTAALMILTSLDVNITPVIAGASVIGLAISFGSQALVRDIVSGIFYLADDAFRVGEYIDCGTAKGTVEGFTLRSIRLRHQNGQIHTIPFGQLQHVTNFSRDWSTLKFNLRFARDTDLEKIRKVTKKVGQAMLEDPELKDDFLEPLKLQGVADIADNALVMRFKLTVRPIRPTYIQREGVKRLIAAFKDAGIEFASATVSVQTVGNGSADIAAAAAAASSAATKHNGG